MLRSGVQLQIGARIANHPEAHRPHEASCGDIDAAAEALRRLLWSLQKTVELPKEGRHFVISEWTKLFKNSPLTLDALVDK